MMENIAIKKEFSDVVIKQENVEVQQNSDSSTPSHQHCQLSKEMSLKSQNVGKNGLVVGELITKPEEGTGENVETSCDVVEQPSESEVRI